MFLPGRDKDRTQSLQISFLSWSLTLLADSLQRNKLNSPSSQCFCHSLARLSQSYEVSPDVQTRQGSLSAREGSSFTLWLYNAQPSGVLAPQDTRRELLQYHPSQQAIVSHSIYRTHLSLSPLNYISCFSFCPHHLTHTSFFRL